MASKTISPLDTLLFGWDTFKKHLGFLLGLMGVLLVILLIAQLPALFSANYVYQTVWGIVVRLIQVFLQIGLLKIALHLVDEKPAVLKDLFSGAPLYLRFLLGALIFGIVVILPLTPLYGWMFAKGYMSFTQPPLPPPPSAIGPMLGMGLPGFLASMVLSLWLMFFSYLIVDKGLWPMPALKGSVTLVKGAFWQLVLLMLLIFVAVIVLLLPFLVFSIIAAASASKAMVVVSAIVGILSGLLGYFILLPILMLATAKVYRTLLSQTPSLE